jgi:hypothetical protein
MKRVFNAFTKSTKRSQKVSIIHLVFVTGLRIPPHGNSRFHDNNLDFPGYRHEMSLFMENPECGVKTIELPHRIGQVSFQRLYGAAASLRKGSDSAVSHK